MPARGERRCIVAAHGEVVGQCDDLVVKEVPDAEGFEIGNNDTIAPVVRANGGVVGARAIRRADRIEGGDVENVGGDVPHLDLVILRVHSPVRILAVDSALEDEDLLRVGVNCEAVDVQIRTVRVHVKGGGDLGYKHLILAALSGEDGNKFCAVAAQPYKAHVVVHTPLR